MIRGTAAQFKFKLPYSYDELKEITIRFWQTGNPSNSLPIFKYKTNCEELSPKEVCVSLRPSETALFSDKYKAKLQLRARPNFGEPFGSQEHLVPVYPMPNDMMDEWPIIPPDYPTEEEWIILDGSEIVS